MDNKKRRQRHPANVHFPLAALRSRRKPRCRKDATSVGMIRIAIVAAAFEAFEAAIPECAAPHDAKPSGGVTWRAPGRPVGGAIRRLALLARASPGGLVRLGCGRRAAQQQEIPAPPTAGSSWNSVNLLCDARHSDSTNKNDLPLQTGGRRIICGGAYGQPQRKRRR
jgi:hypothetical protein